MYIKTVMLKTTDIKKANKFADDRVADNVGLYERRGGFKKEDIIAGAMGEIAVYRLLKENGIEVGKPDFTIHTTRNKSYAADLTDDIHHFHVKSQTLDSKSKYGASWIMQRKDPLVNNPDKLNYLVPCTVDISTGKVEIYGLFNMPSIVAQNCISECKLEWFRKTKVAIYMDHITPIFTKKATWGLLENYKRRY